jgi:hypothetical protein
MIVRRFLVVVSVLALGVWGGIEFERTHRMPELDLTAPPPPSMSSVAHRWRSQVYRPGKLAPVACPTDAFVLLALGQSNAANAAGHRFAAKRDVVAFYGGQCYPAAGPLPGASDNLGSVWPLVGDLLIERGAATRVVIVAAAMGGSRVADWASPRLLGGQLEELLGSLRGSGLAPSAVAWMQGESDHRTAPDAYVRDLRSVFERVWRQFPIRAPVIVAQTTYCAGRDSPGIRAAQAALVAAEHVHAGPDTDRLTQANYRYDDCHFSEQGVRALAPLWADAIASALKTGR